MKRVKLYASAPLVAVQETEPMVVDHDCTACSLYKRTSHPCMSPRLTKLRKGPITKRLLVVAGMPSPATTRVGIPFSSPAESWFRDQLATIADELGEGYEIIFDHALKCGDGNRVTVNASHHNHCRPYMASVVQETQPDLILLLGNHAAKGVLGYDRGSASHVNRRGYAWIYPDDNGIVSKKTLAVLLREPPAPNDSVFVRRLFAKDLRWALTASPKGIPAKAFASVLSPTDADANYLLDYLDGASWFSIDVETYGEHFADDFRLLSLAISADNNEDEVIVITESSLLPDSPLLPVLDYILTSDEWGKKGQNVKYDHQSIRLALGIDMRPVTGDSRLQFKLLNPNGDATLEQMAEMIGMGGHKQEAADCLLPEKKRLKKEWRKNNPNANPRAYRPDAYAYAALPPKTMARYVARDALTTTKLIKVFELALQSLYDGRLWETHQRTVMPASKAIVNLESRGVLVDMESINTLQAYLQIRTSDLADQIASVGVTNPASSQQIGDLLYNTLGVPVRKFTRTLLPSTDKDVLKMYVGEHEVIDQILEWRQLSKLDTTYVNGLMPFIRADGRVHPTFLLDGTGTGRLSCLAEWTLIRTRRRGLVPIKDIQIGDEVWTHKRRWRPVVNHWRVGVRDTYDVRLCSGSVLTCTGNHRLLALGGDWVTTKELADECVKNVGSRRGEPEGRAGVISGRSSAVVDDSDSSGIGHDGAQRILRDSSLHVRRGKKGAEEREIFRSEDGKIESNEGQEGAQSPQLEGDLQGRLWVSDVSAQGAPRIRSQTSHGPDDRLGWAGRNTSDASRSPHRRGYREQRSREFGPGYGAGSPYHTFLAGSGLSGVGVEAVVYRGSCTVYDLTVADDESYESLGVFSHNCKSPNLQNQPARGSESAKMVKNCFIAGPGRVLLQVDYKTLEIRIAAMLSGDPVMIEVIKSGVDFHLATAKLIAEMVWGITPEELEAEYDGGNGVTAKRSVAKTIVFGTLYGQSAVALAGQLRVITGDDKFTPEMATAAQEAILGKYTVLAAWIAAQVANVMVVGEAWTQWDGRPARRRPLYAARGGGKPASTAKISSYNTPIQGTGSDFCLMSIVALDELCEERWGDDCFPIVTVHDSIVFDLLADKALVEEVVWEVHRVMTGWPSGGVPIEVDFDIGARWGSMEKLDVTPLGEVVGNYRMPRLTSNGKGGW